MCILYTRIWLQNAEHYTRILVHLENFIELLNEDTTENIKHERLAMREIKCSHYTGKDILRDIEKRRERNSFVCSLVFARRNCQQI